MKNIVELSHSKIMLIALFLLILIVGLYSCGLYITNVLGFKPAPYYLLLDRMKFNEPPQQDCSIESHQGRLAFTNNGALFLCSGSPQGWHKLAIQQ